MNSISLELSTKALDAYSIEGHEIADLEDAKLCCEYIIQLNQINLLN